jgi:hypothetical protein
MLRRLVRSVRWIGDDLRQWRREPICVAGFPRSGTSWLSRTLGDAAGVRAYHEPFNPVAVPRASIAQFRYAPADDADPEFDRLVLDAFAGRVDSPHVLVRLRPRYRRFRRWPARTLVKTVFGLLALERIAVLTGARIVVIRRAPLDVAASWHRLSWDPERHLARLRAQPRLMAEHLHSFEAMLSGPHDFWSALGALWGASDFVLRRLVDRNPTWTVLDFETLCADPIASYEHLYEELGLRWTAERVARIREDSETSSSRPFELRRIAAEQVEKWRSDGLDPDQVARFVEMVERFRPSVEPVHGSEPE